MTGLIKITELLCIIEGGIFLDSISKSENQFDKNIIHFILIYFLSYFSAYFIYTFLTVYLDDLKFSATQIGIITSVASVIIIFCQGFWGNLADKAKSKNFILMIIIVGTSLSSLLLQINHPTFWQMLCIVSLIYFFFMNIETLSSAITLEYIEHTSWNYSKIRAFGLVGYGSAALIMTFVSSYFSKQNLFLMFSVLTFITMIPVMLSPKIQGGQSMKGSKKSSIFALFHKKYKTLLTVLGLNVLLQSCAGISMAYFGIYFVNHLHAGTNLLSLYFLISVALEVPFMLIASKMAKKIDFKWMLLIVAVCFAARPLFYAFSENIYLLMATALFLGLGNAISFYGNVVFINNSVPPELKASGQGLWGICLSGISKVIANLLGGNLIDHFGMQKVFMGAGFFVILIVLVFYFFIFRNKNLGVIG